MSKQQGITIDALIIRSDSQQIKLRMRVNTRGDRLSIHVLRPSGGSVRVIVPHDQAEGSGGLIQPIGEVMRMLNAFGEVSTHMAIDSTKRLSTMMAAAIISGENPPATAHMKDQCDE